MAWTVMAGRQGRSILVALAVLGIAGLIPGMDQALAQGDPPEVEDPLVQPPKVADTYRRAACRGAQASFAIQQGGIDIVGKFAVFTVDRALFPGDLGIAEELADQAEETTELVASTISYTISAGTMVYNPSCQIVKPPTTVQIRNFDTITHTPADQTHGLSHVGDCFLEPVPPGRILELTFQVNNTTEPAQLTVEGGLVGDPQEPPRDCGEIEISCFNIRGDRINRSMCEEGLDLAQLGGQPCEDVAEALATTGSSLVPELKAGCQGAIRNATGAITVDAPVGEVRFRCQGIGPTVLDAPTNCSPRAHLSWLQRTCEKALGGTVTDSGAFCRPKTTFQAWEIPFRCNTHDFPARLLLLEGFTTPAEEGDGEDLIPS